VPATLLVFPQWQGGGCVPGLREAALALAPRVAGTRHRLDVEVAPIHPLEAEQGIQGRAELLRQLADARARLDSRRPERVFAVGGDCGIEVAVLSYLNAQGHGSLAVVWLDAHGDLNTPQSSPSGHFHGMPLRVLLGDGDPAFTALVDQPLLPAQVVLAGTRALDPPEGEVVKARGFRVISSEALAEDPSSLVRWIRSTGLSGAYVHLDLDVCDPREVPDVACPTPGGPSVGALVRVLRAVSTEVEIVGASLTEATFTGPSIPARLEPLLEWFRDA
jgi:arginase